MIVHLCTLLEITLHFTHIYIYFNNVNDRHSSTTYYKLLLSIVYSRYTVFVKPALTKAVYRFDLASALAIVKGLKLFDNSVRSVISK
jgi:hypothetical protein